MKAGEGGAEGESLEAGRKPPNKPRKLSRVGMKGHVGGIWDSH